MANENKPKVPVNQPERPTGNPGTRDRSPSDGSRPVKPNKNEK